jgi:acetate kinase
MILVINSGSTTIKFKLFLKDKIYKEGVFVVKNDFDKVFKKIVKIIKNDIKNIKAIGHRVVHGGDKYSEPILLNKKTIEDLSRYNYLAPLHNPSNLKGIKTCFSIFPNIPQMAVFDTALYKHLPEIAKTYPINKEISKNLQIKKYGFHGLSHKYARDEVAKKLKKDVKALNLITCHLGGGWSISAFKNGKVLETSMGMTPTGGLPMMTRSGDIDPGVVLKIIKESGIKNTEKAVSYAEDILNSKSGIKGLNQKIKNYKDLLERIPANDEFKFIFDFAIYNLCKYIGSYWAVLEGRVDAIVFTGSIGSGNPITVNAVKKKLKILKDTPFIKIESNEELVIAREIRKTLKSEF